MKNTTAADKEDFSVKKYTICFLIHHENVCCGYLLEDPCRSMSYEYPKCMLSWRNKKNICLDTPLVLGYAISSCVHQMVSKQIMREGQVVCLTKDPISGKIHFISPQEEC